jgi:phage tail-like protein
VLDEQSHGTSLEGVAIAARDLFVAVADRSGRVRILVRPGLQVVGEIFLHHPGPLTFAPWRELIVTGGDREQPHLLRYSLTGERLGAWPFAAPGPVDRLAFSADRRLWLVTRHTEGLRVWVATRPREDCDDGVTSTGSFEPASLDDLREAFPRSNLSAVGSLGFCVTVRDRSGRSVSCCYSWMGRCVEYADIGADPPPRRFRQGQLLTAAIDSGVPGCAWHRVRIDADVPRGTAVEIAVSPSADPQPTPQGHLTPPGPWSAFATGVPHPDDWQINEGGALDFLIRRPPGRYLFVRLRLSGDGAATPVVRRIRLDFERATSLDHLPSVYRETPDVEDFTERFLSIFDATIGQLDDAIAAAPALLDGASVPDEILPWLASLVDVVFDREWSTAQRRRILRAIPDLYRQRGTPGGLRQAIVLALGVDAAIEEHALGRAWGGLRAHTIVGQTRLFGQSRVRLRLGSSALGSAPLNSFGDPREDPFASHAHRFSVRVAPTGEYGAVRPDKLAALVEAQKPAHAVARDIRLGGDGFVIGRPLAIGIDTAFARLPAAVLGRTGNVRLGRKTVLTTRWPDGGAFIRAGHDDMFAHGID